MSVVDYVNGVGYNAIDFRLANLSGFIGDPSDPLTPLAGRVYGVNLAVGGTIVSWSAGVLVLASASNGNGVYRKVIPTGNLTLSARPSAGSRIDVIVCALAGVELDANITVIQGTASSAPVQPPAPLGALVLGTVLVPAIGGSAISITNTQSWARAHGAVLPMLSTQNTPAVTPGQLVHYLDLPGQDSIHMFTGTDLVEETLFDAMGGLEYGYFNCLHPTDNQSSAVAGTQLRFLFTAARRVSDGSNIGLYNDTGGGANFINLGRAGFYVFIGSASWSYNTAGKDIGWCMTLAGTTDPISNHSFGGNTSGVLGYSTCTGNAFGYFPANTQVAMRHESNLSQAVNVSPELLVVRLGT